jgi:hypothetical protein
MVVVAKKWDFSNVLEVLSEKGEAENVFDLGRDVCVLEEEERKVCEEKVIDRAARKREEGERVEEEKVDDVERQEKRGDVVSVTLTYFACCFVSYDDDARNSRA